jgi:nucleotide-binding universal stress UspA family protein
MTLYRHLGAAVAFSPRLQALLAETAYRARMLASRLSLIHAGAHTAEKEAKLRAAMHMAGIAAETDIHWIPGTPDEAILSVVKAQNIDLLLAGALEKEQPLRYYLGSVAHRLVREAPCSLMLLTDPQVQPKPIRRIVVVVDYSEQSLISLTKAIRLAEQAEGEQIHVLRVLSQFGTAIVLSEGMRQERARTYQATTRAEETALLQDLVDAAGQSRVPVKTHCLEGHGGRVVADFARQQQANLLVMPSTNQHSHFFERLFPSDMEWVLREIPCNLWVVREKMH